MKTLKKVAKNIPKPNKNMFIAFLLIFVFIGIMYIVVIPTHFNFDVSSDASFKMGPVDISWSGKIDTEAKH